MALPPENTPPRPEAKAQRKAAEQDVFMREVDDALREEELKGAFRRWGIIGACVLLVALAGLGGYLFWQQQARQAEAEHAEQFTIALDEVEAGRLDVGAKKLEALSANSDDAIEAAARMLQGGIASEQGNTAEAVRTFEALAADESAPQVYRDLATIRAVATNFDTMKAEDVVARLKPLAQAGKPWFASAGELVGLAYLKQGKNDLAGPLFAEISRDKDAPETLRSRAQQMAGLLGVDAIDDVARAAGTTPGQN